MHKFRNIVAVTAGAAILCCCLVHTTAHANTYNILMIGNSYIQGNSSARATSLDLQGFFDADPDHSASITVCAESSASLQGHAGNPSTTSVITSTGIDWDVIILQERSDRPALAMKFGGSELTGLRRGAPKLIDDFIQPFQPQASVLFFNSWARFPGEENLVDNFNNDPDEMLAYTNQGYDYLRLHSPNWDYTAISTIARVGDAWSDWYAAHGYGSQTRLHLSDGTHQNDLGAYLAAAVLFESITHKSSIGNPYAGAVSGTVGGTALMQLLQEQASTTTGLLADSADFDSDLDIDGEDFLAWQRGFGTSVGADPSDGDANHDGAVNGLDLSIWETQFENFQPLVGQTQRVPEPSSTLALTLLSLGLFSRRVHHDRCAAHCFVEKCNGLFELVHNFRR